MKQVWIDIAADSANTHLPATIQHVRPTATPPAVEGLRATQQAAASVVATAAAAAAEGASIAGADDGSAAGPASATQGESATLHLVPLDLAPFEQDDPGAGPANAADVGFVSTFAAGAAGLLGGMFASFGSGGTAPTPKASKERCWHCQLTVTLYCNSLQTMATAATMPFWTRPRTRGLMHGFVQIRPSVGIQDMMQNAEEHKSNGKLVLCADIIDAMPQSNVAVKLLANLKVRKSAANLLN